MAFTKDFYFVHLEPMAGSLSGDYSDFIISSTDKLEQFVTNFIRSNQYLVLSYGIDMTVVPVIQGQIESSREINIFDFVTFEIEGIKGIFEYDSNLETDDLGNNLSEFPQWCFFNRQDSEDRRKEMEERFENAKTEKEIKCGLKIKNIKVDLTKNKIPLIENNILKPDEVIPSKIVKELLDDYSYDDQDPNQSFKSGCIQQNVEGDVFITEMEKEYLDFWK
jgi:hypothetical protein